MPNTCEDMIEEMVRDRERFLYYHREQQVMVLDLISRGYVVKRCDIFLNDDKVVAEVVQSSPILKMMNIMAIAHVDTYCPEQNKLPKIFQESLLCPRTAFILFVNTITGWKKNFPHVKRQ